jgi:sugar lactone lactonase YvrE
MTKNYEIKKLAEGFVWGEGLRWYGDKLYWSDIMGKKVFRTDLNGNMEKIADIPANPTGLGFLPNGNLIIVSAGESKLLQWTENDMKEYADIKGLSIQVNDMVVDKKGYAYVGAYGFEITNYQGGPAEGWLILVKPGEKPKAVGKGAGLMGPNGIVVSPDGKTLIAADTVAKQFIAFDIQEDGDLINGRVWAKTEYGPDGICIDAEGAIWAAMPHNSEVVRVAEGGKILERIPFDSTPLCCTLGGKDRKTLFVVTVPAHKSEDLSKPEQHIDKAGSKIYTTQVSVSGAGCP